MATPLDSQMNSALNPEQEEPQVPASFDASGALPQDISVEPPAQPELVAGEEQRRRLQEVSGLEPMDIGKTLPEKVQQARVQPIYETSPSKQMEYYERFFRYEDPETEQFNRDDLEAATVFYVPIDAKKALEQPGGVAADPSNFEAFRFPGEMTVEQKAAVIATSGAHAFGYRLPESAEDNPYSIDSYMQIQPRYMSERAQQATPAQGAIPGVTPAILAKDEIGRGKEELAKIYTDMGITNPADQTALLAAEDIDAFTSERMLSGATQTIDFIWKALKWTGKKATQGLTYEESLYLPNGAVVSMQEAGDILISTADIAGRRAAIESKEENTGMFTIDKDGKKVLRPEFAMDYVGALVAEGMDPDAADQFVTYMPDAAGQTIRLFGEEAIFGSASAAIRYGIALGQVRGFSNWVERTYGSAEEAFKRGKDGARLAVEYAESYGGGRLNDWARNMSVNSMRIKLDVHGNLPGFSAADNVKAAGRRMNELTVEHKRAIDARHRALSDGNIEAADRYSARVTELEEQIKRVEKMREGALEEVYKGSWINDTLKTTGYGIGGAALAGELVSQHFGGPEYAPLAEILGFVSGHTAFNIAGRGTMGALKWVGMRTDDLVQLPAGMFGIVDARIFEKAGLYTDIDKLTKEQRAVVRSLQGLTGPQKQAAMASARYITDLQGQLRGIRDQNGNPLFTDDFLEQTLGVVTGLNLLTLADRQLTKGISLGEIKDLGPGFYAKQEILSKKTDMVRQLNYAVEQLLPAVADSSTNKELREFVSGIDSYRKQLSKEIDLDSQAVLERLNFREQLIVGVLGQDPQALRRLGFKPGEDIEAAKLHKLLEADDDLFVKAQTALGVPAEQAVEALNERIRARTKNITDAAKSYMQTVNGSAFAGGPETVATQIHYSIRAGHYGTATSKYKILNEKYGDNALMSVTEVYDELAKNPALVGQFDMPAMSQGAMKAGNLDLPRSDVNNFRLLFNDAAERTMTDVEGRLRAAAEAAGEDADEYLETMYGYLGVRPGSTAIDRWEALRAGLQGDTSKVTKEASDSVQALLGGPENAKAYSARMPLLININEFQQITSGLNTKVRNVYQKKATGKEAIAPKYLYEIMHDAAVDPRTGFQFNYLDKNQRAPATEVYEALKDANKTYREEYAERYLRGGPAQQVGTGVPPSVIPDLDKARSTGVVEKDEIFDVFTGELRSGLQSTDRVSRITSNLAQSYGQRVPEGGVEIVMKDGTKRMLPEGSFVFIQGEESTEGLRAAMTLHAIDEMRRSPGGTVIRNWIDGAGMTEEKQIKLLMEGQDIGSFDLNYMENLARMPMLSRNADGTYSEVSLIDMDRAYQEINIAAAMQADPLIKQHSDDAVNEFKTFIARMRNEAKIEAGQAQDELRALEVAARDLGADPASFFTKQFESGDTGFQAVSTLRQAIVDQAKRDAREQGLNPDETKVFVGNVTGRFDDLRKQHFSSWVRSKTEGLSETTRAQVDPQTGATMNVKIKGFKSGELARILGTDGGPDAAMRRELALEMLGGDEEHYEALSAVADWGLLNQASVPSNVKIDDIPTGLSIESWISRIYSINRGVVSPRYVGAEALIQSFRMNGLSVVEAMVNDKKLAAQVQKILTSNKPLPSEQENYEFMQAMMTAAGMTMVRWDKLEDIEDVTGGEPIEITMPPRPEDTQMLEMQTQLGGA